MRRLLTALFLSTALSAPALAEPDDDRKSVIERVREAREERRSANEQARAERRAEEPQVRVMRADRADRSDDERSGLRIRNSGVDQPVERAERRRERIEERVRESRTGEPGPAATSADGVASWRERERRRDGRPVLNGERIEQQVEQRRPRGLNGQIQQGLARNGLSGTLIDPNEARRWREEWRRDNRYDWRRHRDRHRSLFRFGAYYDPFGWGYRRVWPGWSVYPSYYSNRYWLNDPWEYRLPHVGYPYQWVRYWDDALLVNVRTGQVVDVIHGVFW